MSGVHLDMDCSLLHRNLDSRLQSEHMQIKNQKSQSEYENISTPTLSRSKLMLLYRHCGFAEKCAALPWNSEFDRLVKASLVVDALNAAVGDNNDPQRKIKMFSNNNTARH